MKNNTFQRLPFLEQFRSGLFWNFFDSIGTQALLIVYHFLFRLFFGGVLHGIMGCLLSLFYLATIVCNLGLDYSLAPFLELITRSKRTLRSFFYLLLLPQLVYITALAALWYTYYPYASSLFSIFKSIEASMTSTLAGIIALTFIVESMRKTLKYFLQLLFYTRLTASVEVAGTALYLLVIIVSYSIRGSLTLEESWESLLIILTLQLIAFSIGCWHFYSTATSTDEASIFAQHPALIPRILKSRLFVWANQSMNQLFSGNFLVPVCALHFGIEHASLMKVMTSISAWVTLIANKTFGITSNALLAHLKFRSAQTQRTAFSYLTSLLNQALYFLLIFLLINGKKIALLQVSPTSTISWSLLYFLLIIAFFESLFILYEKWYIFEEKAHYYFLFNGICFALIYSLIAYTASPLAILLLVITLRAATFIILTLFSFYWWRIWPSFKPPLKMILFSCIVSGLFYFLL